MTQQNGRNGLLTLIVVVGGSAALWALILRALASFF